MGGSGNNQRSRCFVFPASCFSNVRHQDVPARNDKYKAYLAILNFEGSRYPPTIDDQAFQNFESVARAQELLFAGSVRMSGPPVRVRKLRL